MSPFSHSVSVLSSFSRVRLLAILWTVAHQAPLFMAFSRQEYRSGLPCRFPGDFPNLGIKPTSLASPALAGRFFTTRLQANICTIFIEFNASRRSYTNNKLSKLSELERKTGTAKVLWNRSTKHAR